MQAQPLFRFGALALTCAVASLGCSRSGDPPIELRPPARASESASHSVVATPGVRGIAGMPGRDDLAAVRVEMTGPVTFVKRINGSMFVGGKSGCFVKPSASEDFQRLVDDNCLDVAAVAGRTFALVARRGETWVVALSKGAELASARIHFTTAIAGGGASRLLYLIRESMGGAGEVWSISPDLSEAALRPLPGLHHGTSATYIFSPEGGRVALRVALGPHAGGTSYYEVVGQRMTPLGGWCDREFGSALPLCIMGGEFQSALFPTAHFGSIAHDGVVAADADPGDGRICAIREFPGTRQESVRPGDLRRADCSIECASASGRRREVMLTAKSNGSCGSLSINWGRVYLSRQVGGLLSVPLGVN